MKMNMIARREISICSKYYWNILLFSIMLLIIVNENK